MSSEFKKLLITGGAGFIGSAVIRHIINNSNNSVVNIDKLTYAGNIESIDSIKNNARYVFEKEDICNADEVKRIFIEHEPDIVMHLAAESHVDRSIDWQFKMEELKLSKKDRLLPYLEDSIEIFD